MMKQKDAVYQALKTVLSESGTKHTDGQKANVDAETIKLIETEVLAMYERKEWGVQRQQESMSTYVNGLVRNHLRRDTRLNGGKTYKPEYKRPNGSPEIRELRKLVARVEKPEDKARVQTILDSKLAEIDAEKNKIDVEVLSDETKTLIKGIV